MREELGEPPGLRATACSQGSRTQPGRPHAARATARATPPRATARVAPTIYDAAYAALSSAMSMLKLVPVDGDDDAPPTQKDV